MQELIISIPILILTSFLIYKTNPRYCSRCYHGTLFPMYQNLQANPNYPIMQYCLKCFFYINLSEWKCENCKRTGTNRIHWLNPISRLLVIIQIINAYKKCECGNKVELKQIG